MKCYGKSKLLPVKRQFQLWRRQQESCTVETKCLPALCNLSHRSHCLSLCPEDATQATTLGFLYWMHYNRQQVSDNTLVNDNIKTKHVLSTVVVLEARSQDVLGFVFQVSVMVIWVLVCCLLVIVKPCLVINLCCVLIVESLNGDHLYLDQ